MSSGLLRPKWSSTEKGEFLEEKNSCELHLRRTNTSGTSGTRFLFGPFLFSFPFASFFFILIVYLKAVRVELGICARERLAKSSPVTSLSLYSSFLHHRTSWFVLVEAQVSGWTFVAILVRPRCPPWMKSVRLSPLRPISARYVIPAWRPRLRPQQQQQNSQCRGNYSWSMYITAIGFAGSGPGSR